MSKNLKFICPKCHYKKASSQEELDAHFNKIHAKSEKYSKTRQAFLSTLLSPENKYQELHINGFWLVKSLNRSTWQVAIYTEDAFKKYKLYKSK